jgi:SAM-dependent methyltransferase
VNTEEVKDVWRNYWAQNRGNELLFDEMSKTILEELLKSCECVKGKRILEAGCGRGMISLAMTELGANVYLLDISPDALQIAKNHFSSKNIHASFAHGDILSPPFKAATFDIIWNAGVMEHFKDNAQLRILRDLTNMIKPGGFFITFNPYDGAFFYKIGKRFAEQKGRWPYGPEFPVRSLKKKCKTAGLTVLKEYAICFKENLAYFSYVSKPLRSILKRMLKPFPDKLLIRVFGGYLLVTVAVKHY